MDDVLDTGADAWKNAEKTDSKWSGSNFLRYTRKEGQRVASHRSTRRRQEGVTLPSFQRFTRAMHQPKNHCGPRKTTARTVNTHTLREFPALPTSLPSSLQLLEITC